jgi:sigma-B regulation protein RsbU (phosphoserine phosphatase)
VARLHDWWDLGKNTLLSLKPTDVSNFYSFEWPETKRILIADHASAIENDPRRFRRWLRTASAVMYGLAKRLAPLRRFAFLFAQIYFVFCLVSLFSSRPRVDFFLILELAGTFILMTTLLALEIIDKLKFRDELELARELQASLLPKFPPRTASYDIAAHNTIANMVGGDIYDFVPLPDGRIAVLFGDASGHGMAAGLVMAVAHAAFRTQLEVDPAPASIIPSLNRILCRTGGNRSFFACCYVLLEPDGNFVATIAGHPPIIKADGGGKVVERIGRGAYPLGIKLDMQWDEVRGWLAPGERLVLHSDGLTEARNASGREFGDAYLDSIIAWNGVSPAHALAQRIVAEWTTFSAGRPVEDDVSLAVIEKR